MKSSDWLVIIGKGNSREIGREVAQEHNCEAWGVNSVERYPELTLLWEMHRWRPEIKKLNPVQIDMLPVMMQDVYIDVPNAVKYPKDHLEKVYRGPLYANNTIAYMLALAITKKRINQQRWFNHIFLAGIDYRSADRTEMEFERACTEYWIGFAEAHGIQVYWPEESNLKTFAGYVSGVQYGYSKMAPELVKQHRDKYDHTAAEILLLNHADESQYKPVHNHQAFYDYLIKCVKNYKKPR